MKKIQIAKFFANKEHNTWLTFYSKIPTYLICLLVVLLPVTEARINLKIHTCELPLIPGNDGMYYDVAVRFREIVIFSAAIFLLLYWLIDFLFLKKDRQNILFTKKALAPVIFIGGYIFFVIISSIFSEYAEISFWGMTSLSEGIAANLGYAVLFLAAYSCFGNESSLRMLCNSASLSAAIIYVEFVIERITGGLSSVLWNTASSGKAVVLLFGNSAYCGAFCVLILPLAICSAFTEHNTAPGIVKSFFAGMLVPIIIGSYSSIAFYAACICVTAILVYMAFNKKTDKKCKIMTFICIFTAIGMFLLINRHFVTDILINDATNAGAYSSEESWGLTNAKLDGKTLRLENAETAITIESVNENKANIYDKNGIPICELQNNTQIKFKGDYEKVSLALADGYLIVDLGYDEEIRFFYDNKNLYFVGANGHLTANIPESAFTSLSDYYSFGTGRGYIWLNSVPILEKCFFKGVGAGQYAFYFPQYDFVGALNTHGNARVVTDKPHSLYLGIAISYGIPAFLIFCAIVFFVIKSGVIGAFKEKSFFNAALLISVLVFLFMGIANDSTPIFSPLFWIYAGAVLRKEK